jgi:Peptidase S46
MHRLILLGAAALIPMATAWADEGMWTFQNFPSAVVKQKYGADITQSWLDRVRTATVRLSGCTGSFVSPEGLILTNHHCAASCLADNSTKDESLLDTGFYAETREKEVRCQTQVADVLLAMEEITAKVNAATQGLDDKAANDKRKQTLTELEQACEQASRKDRKTGPLKCDSVTLYDGGQYYLYKYKRYDDVRLVFAPEEDIAAFGGDPDNFQYPRWCLDMSMLRVYDSSGKPAKTPNHLTLDPTGPDPGEVVFVSGHPASTERLLTVSQLEFLRDVDLPLWLLRYAELRGRYVQFSKASAESRRIVADSLSGLENSIKVHRKLLDALHDEAMIERKKQDEAALRAQMPKDIGDPWGDIEKAEQTERAVYTPYLFLEGASGFNSQLFRYARVLVRGAAERDKPPADRLREFRDTALRRIEQQLRANVPVYPELEQITLSFSLERMREFLGPDNPVIRAILSKDSPDSLAARLIEGSKLADPQERIRLWQGGTAAIKASNDPMILLAQQVDADSRAVRKRYEDEVEAPIQAASERIAKARFAALGTSVYPDANFTLRLNFGTVQGWVENGEPVEPFTHLDRLFERATGLEPFRIPERWEKAKPQLDLATKYDFSTNNDIVGGNSGSPLIDAQGRIVGLMFDGNIHSISGSYWFDAEKNRAVAVHPASLLLALDKVYNAQTILKELGVR